MTLGKVPGDLDVGGDEREPGFRGSVPLILRDLLVDVGTHRHGLHARGVYLLLLDEEETLGLFFARDQKQGLVAIGDDDAPELSRTDRFTGAPHEAPQVLAEALGVRHVDGRQVFRVHVIERGGDELDELSRIRIEACTVEALVRFVGQLVPFGVEVLQM